MTKQWGQQARSLTLTLGSTLGAICLLWTLGVALTGVKPLVFLSGSMSPAINAGDVGFARTVPADRVAVGDVISVISSTGERVTHRVAQTSVAGASATFRTKGDANNTIDAESYSLSSAELIVAVLPKLGYVLTFAASPLGIGLGVALIAACAWLGFARRPDEEDALLTTKAAEPSVPAVMANDSSTKEPPAAPRRSRVASRRPHAKAVAGLVPVVVAAVWLGSTLAPSGTTLAYFSDRALYSSPTDEVFTAPWFTCWQATSAASYGSQPWLHYNFNEAAGTQLAPTEPFFQDDSGNARNGIYFVGPNTAGVTPSTGWGHACARDISSTSISINGTSSANAQFVREQSNSLTLNGGAGDRWNKFTINIWFKTQVTGTQDKAGALAAYPVSGGNLDAATDRVLYMDTNGYIRFEVYPGSYKFVTAATNYATTNGTWLQPPWVRRASASTWTALW